MQSNAETPQQIGPYRIDAEVTRTRTLLVYRAHDTLYDRAVVLKVLPSTLAQNTALVRRFISLGRDAARLHHPNLAEVYEAGHADGVNYIAQELVNGGSLASRLQSRHHPYLIYDAIVIIEQIAAALDYAHQQGYAHGGLTAESVLFTAEGQPKLMDIGLLALETLGEKPTYVTNVTPYMAPEQARGESGVERQADIYTLGVLSFLMLTGQTPFAAENPLALLRKSLTNSHLCPNYWVVSFQPPCNRACNGFCPKRLPPVTPPRLPLPRPWSKAKHIPQPNPILQSSVPNLPPHTIASLLTKLRRRMRKMPQRSGATL
ncbi:MAG: serine/threonine-protein kinase [Caldilineaceae bacterium]